MTDSHQLYNIYLFGITSLRLTRKRIKNRLYMQQHPPVIETLHLITKTKDAQLCAAIALPLIHRPSDL